MFPTKEYKIVGKFKQSTRKNKKYMISIIHNTSKKKHTIHFGDSRYGQFRDSTCAGIYTHLDTHDNKRKLAYRARHAKTFNKSNFSPAFFSWIYLWS